MGRPPGRPGLDPHRHRRTQRLRTPRLPDRIPESLRRRRGQATRGHGTGTVLHLATRSRGHRRQPRPRRARALTPFDSQHEPDRQRRPGARCVLPRHHRILTLRDSGGRIRAGRGPAVVQLLRFSSVCDERKDDSDNQGASCLPVDREPEPGRYYIRARVHVMTSDL